MLTAKQHELLLFIQRKLEETGISPSFEEMKEALDLKSKSGVHRLISALEERGFIRRLPNRARALEVLKQPEDVSAGRRAERGQSTRSPASPGLTRQPRPQPANDVIEIPLHGRIAAGVPIEAMEGDRTLPVPAALLGAGEHYALEVSGDSMIEAGIFDGDFALVRKTDTARDGEIVVALVRNEEATLKYLRHENGKIRLDPANGAYDPQIYAGQRGRGAGQARRAAAPLSLTGIGSQRIRRLGRCRTAPRCSAPAAPPAMLALVVGDAALPCPWARSMPRPPVSLEQSAGRP